MSEKYSNRGSKTWLLVVIPLIMSLTGLALSLVAVMAGRDVGKMEDVHIIQLNMSNFGHDLIQASQTTGGSSPTTTSGGGLGDLIPDAIESLASSIGDDLTDIANDIANDIADKLSAELGISQWYSLHVMDACQGNYKPNATTPNAGLNVTNCTDARPGFHFNLTETLDKELGVGPLKLNLADLDYPEEIDDAIRYLNQFMLAVFVFYVLAAAFSALDFLLCIAALVLKTTKGGIALSSLLVTVLAVLTMGIGSAITTAVARKGEQKINEYGDDVGISATAGAKFMIISWVAFAVMLVAFLAWFALFCVGREKGARRGLFGSKSRV